MKHQANDLPWYAGGDPWVLTQSVWSPDETIYFETIFTQSNGYLGVRGYTEEAYPNVVSVREAYLAGVFGEVDEAAMSLLQVRYPWPSLQMISLPELFGCQLKLDGEPFSMGDGTIEFFSRTLDLRDGSLTRHILWRSPGGKRTRLQFARFLSASVPHLGMQRISLCPVGWDGEARISFALDAATPTYFRCGDRALPHPPQQILESPRLMTRSNGLAAMTVTVRGTGHAVGVAAGMETSGRVTAAAEGSVLRQAVRLSLVDGVVETVTRSVAVIGTRDGLKPEQVPVQAIEIAEEACRDGYERVLEESAAVWEHRWASSDIVIDGPARDQAYIRFSAFSMLQMAPFHTDTMSIPARAYAYNRYHGLYYWDSETFLLPHYLHTHPEVAAHLLRFRYRTLDGARRTARRLHAAGACYPWMTDADDGAEQAPWSIGDYVWHQNADIAYAIDQYVAATGDLSFMAEAGLEMLIETARFWMSRLERDAHGVLHLHNTVGPDELDKHGRDNGYTSLMARRNLELALHWLDQQRILEPDKTSALIQKLELGAGEAVSWREAAARMAVPNVPGRFFPLQDEFLLAKEPLSFDGLTADEAFAKRHTHRVVKQADIILAMYLLQQQFSVEQMRAAYDFYEPMCLHYSSLSYNTHAIIASKIGRPQQAYDYFMKAAGLDLDDLRGATRDGLHAAALAGTWLTIAYGFLNLRIEGDTLLLDPRLPEAWKEIRLTLVFRGYRLAVRCNHLRHEIRVDAAEGRVPALIAVDGVLHPLEDRAVIRVVPQAVA